MNTCIVTGRLTRNAVLNGQDNKALQFTVAAKHGYNSEKEEEMIEYVPCVLFNPSDRLTELLTQNGKGVFVEFEGRVASSRYEKEGTMVYKTKVVVINRSFSFVSSPQPDLYV